MLLISKQEASYLQNLAPKLFQDHNKIVWVRLSDYKYPRTALYLPQKYRKLALCEAHNNQFGGHNAALKTYIRISSSYYWPKIYSDVLNHTKSCLRCQQRKIHMFIFVSRGWNCLNYPTCGSNRQLLKLQQLYLSAAAAALFISICCSSLIYQQLQQPYLSAATAALFISSYISLIYQQLQQLYL